MLYLLGFIFIVFYTFPSIVLSCLQFKHINSHINKNPIILSPKDWQEAGEYSLAKLRVSIIQNIIEAVVFVLWIGIGLFGLENFLKEWDIFENVYFLTYVLIFLIIGAIISIPMSFYVTMKLDKKYGFAKGTLSLFIKDTLKEFAMLIIIAGIVVFLLIEIIENFYYWWVYSFLLVFMLAILANVLYPILIAPIFNKFTSLNDDNLREQIEYMMKKVGFRASGIFVMDASRRDGRLNAYFGGLGKSKRVVLFDTLLQKVSQEGLLAILGHELGHFKHKDILKNIVIMGIVLFILFFIAGNLPQELFNSIGIEYNPATMIVFLLLISPVVSFWAMPIIGYFSRKAEYGADEYGAELTNKRALAEALIRLVNENKAFPCSHPLYIFFYYTHPPLLERLRALDYQGGGVD
ncbi:peptidase M48 [Helicobacter sp. 11S03491-1]|nr:peptidase M48 [Helicobacter sp. 11S03491-1]